MVKASSPTVVHNDQPVWHFCRPRSLNSLLLHYLYSLHLCALHISSPVQREIMVSKTSNILPEAPQPLSQRLLCTIDRAEIWLRENPYFTGHYRKASHSYRASFASLGYLHNQTSNIYTHLAGAALFLHFTTQTFDSILQRYTTSNFENSLVVLVFLL